MTPQALKQYIRALCGGLLLIPLTLAQRDALAQPKPNSSSARTASKVASPASRLKARTAQRRLNQASTTKQQGQTAGKGKVIEFKQLSVEGTVQRPSAAYFLQRRKLKFRGIEPRKSFIPEILTSVKRYPF